MTMPDRIWAKTHGASTDVLSGQRGLIGGWNEHRRDGQSAYLRQDGETLAGIVKAANDLCRHIGIVTPPEAVPLSTSAMLAQRLRAELAKMEGKGDG